jgi:hypothetical protein
MHDFEIRYGECQMFVGSVDEMEKVRCGVERCLTNDLFHVSVTFQGKEGNTKIWMSIRHVEYETTGVFPHEAQIRTYV